MADAAPIFRTRTSLRGDIERLGVLPGDTVMVHAAMRRVGRVLNGADALIGALLDATAPHGTIIAYTDWDAGYEALLDGDGRVPAQWRERIPPFDAARSRAARDNGVLAEVIRTSTGARRRIGSPPIIRSTTATAKARRWRNSSPPAARF